MQPPLRFVFYIPDIFVGKKQGDFHLAGVGMEVTIHCNCSLLEQLLYQLLHLADKDHRSIHAVGPCFCRTPTEGPT